MHKIIQVLNESGFIRFNNWLNNNDGHLNPVFIGEFYHPAAANIEAFCKVYNPKSKGLINEIVGYLMGKALAVKQPDYAFVAIIPKKKLNKFSLIAKREGNQWMASLGEQIICFCTARMDGHSAAIHLKNQKDSKSLSTLCDDISKWSDYSAAIALDENIAHVDRHLNNLLRLDKQSYAIIDNGRLINELDEDWDISMLDTNRNYPNKILAALEYRKCKMPSDDDIYSKSILNSETHDQKMKSIESELKFWLNALLPETEWAEFLLFLTNRTKETPCLLKKRFQLI